MEISENFKNAIIKKSSINAFPLIKDFIEKEYFSYKKMGLNPMQNRFYEMMAQDLSEFMKLSQAEYLNWRITIIDFVVYACTNMKFKEEEAIKNGGNFNLKF